MQNHIYIWVWIQPRAGDRKGLYLLELKKSIPNALLKGIFKVPLSKKLDHCPAASSVKYSGLRV